MAMKEVDREFWTSYLDDILTFSGEPRANLGHLAQVVHVHAATGIKIQPCKNKLFQSSLRRREQCISGREHAGRKATCIQEHERRKSEAEE